MLGRDIGQYQIRTSQETIEWLRKLAKEQDRSMNWVINKILTEQRIKNEGSADCEVKK